MRKYRPKIVENILNPSPWLQSKSIILMNRGSETLQATSDRWECVDQSLLPKRRRLPAKRQNLPSQSKSQQTSRLLAYRTLWHRILAGRMLQSTLVPIIILRRLWIANGHDNHPRSPRYIRDQCASLALLTRQAAKQPFPSHHSVNTCSLSIVALWQLSSLRVFSFLRLYGHCFFMKHRQLLLSAHCPLPKIIFQICTPAPRFRPPV